MDSREEPETYHWLQVFFRGTGIILIALATVAGAFAQDTEGPDGYQFIVGPRLGASYVLMSRKDFSEAVSEFYPEERYLPITSLFGISFEQRILLGETRSHFAFQEVFLLRGLEQSVALPSASLLVGYRDASGFEIGAGPNLTLSGLGVVIASGWTFYHKGVFVPVNVSAVLPNAKIPSAISLTTGFNFVTRRRASFRQ